MELADAVEHMTKAYLHRIIDSFTKDLPKPDQERAREIILRNTEELTDPERIDSLARLAHAAFATVDIITRARELERMNQGLNGA